MRSSEFCAESNPVVSKKNRIKNLVVMSFGCYGLIAIANVKKYIGSFKNLAGILAITLVLN